ncbi:unnamed protein product [Danaus chrysippus]|uniref:(African queen) hypothetical protein n=1 Tax=Danaus chrysippus TaxID=151541 RepID=A0A8J2QMY2_9NEOP|nr:unnamed protein product [Danaus chrysippus]
MVSGNCGITGSIPVTSDAHARSRSGWSSGERDLFNCTITVRDLPPRRKNDAPPLLIGTGLYTRIDTKKKGLTIYQEYNKLVSGEALTPRKRCEHINRSEYGAKLTLRERHHRFLMAEDRGGGEVATRVGD